MRIAVSGTHGVGKSTLLDDFVQARPDFTSMPEPWLLAGDGMAFADGLSIEDLEDQLHRSCALILSAGADEKVIFDRCPLDFVVYLEVASRAEGFEWEPSGKLLGLIDRALDSLDLLVFVPLRQPDEIAVTIESPRLRRSVDRRFKAIIRQDDTGLVLDRSRVLEVFGTRHARLQRLLARIDVKERL